MRNRRIGKIAAVLVAAAAMGISPATATLTVAPDAPRLKPPAPEPQFISRLDLLRIQAIRADLDRRNYSPARVAADSVENPIARDLALWYYFYADDPAVSLEDALAFLDAHPDWPALGKIQGQAEKRLSNATPTDFILRFFQSRDPITSHGKLQLARALYGAGEREAADLHIRDAWINDDFTLEDERALLSRYGGALSADDHAARVDRLLWGRQVTTARRIFSRLSSDERRRAEVRAQLILAAKGADAAYAGLAAADRDNPGVMLAAVRYYRRAGEEPRAATIARLAPTDPAVLRNPFQWWYERQLLMRWALKEKLYEDAYAMAAGHGLEPGSTEFSEAEFNAGWIALRFLGEADRAKVHFAALSASVSAPISLARGYYWMGRAADATGETDDAKRRYEQAAAHAYTFYGQLAAEAIGKTPVFAPAPDPSPADQARFASRPAAQALRMLTEIDDPRAFLIFGYYLDDVLETAGEYVALGDLAMRAGAPHVAVRAGKAGAREGTFAPQVSYPLVFVPDEATAFAPSEVILGLSRQESEFNPRAYSRAGARGMMQLLPSTAKITARKERLAYNQSALLDDPHYNMIIGSAHVSHLLTDFRGSYPMVFAGYNAGPHRVKRWIEEYGDPRADDIDPIDWIELIPFAETRNYVQRVLENMQVYRSQINNAPLAGGLAADIERGGAPGRVGRAAGLTPRGGLIALQERIAAVAEPIMAPPAPPAALAPAPDEKVVDAAPAEAKRNDKGRRAGSRRSAPESTNAGAGGAVVSPQQAPAGTSSEKSEAPARKPARGQRADASAAASSPAEQAPSGASLLDQLNTAHLPDTASEPGAGAVTGGSGAGLATGQAAGAIAVSFTGDESSAQDEADEACLSYVDYIAGTESDEASADDLNAGARAEWRSGGGCEASEGDTPIPDDVLPSSVE